jgi:hypothetical protein
MPTRAEYRHMADQVLKLAYQATEPYAKEALLELAAEFRKAATDSNSPRRAGFRLD